MTPKLRHHRRPLSPHVISPCPLASIPQQHNPPPAKYTVPSRFTGPASPDSVGRLVMGAERRRDAAGTRGCGGNLGDADEGRVPDVQGGEIRDAAQALGNGEGAVPGQRVSSGRGRGQSK